MQVDSVRYVVGRMRDLDRVEYSEYHVKYDKNEIYCFALSEDWQRLGELILKRSTDGLYVRWIEVDHEYRRRGIATGMLDKLKASGYAIEPDDWLLTVDGFEWAIPLVGWAQSVRLFPEREQIAV